MTASFNKTVVNRAAALAAVALLTNAASLTAQTAANPPPLSSPVLNSAAMQAWKNATVKPVAPEGRHSIHSYFNANPESPDGRYVLYFSSTAANGEFGDIVIIERATNTERTLATGVTTEDAHRVACQQWISGGKQVAYNDCRDGKWVVCVVDVATGKERVLAEERQLCFGAPNGEWLPLYGYHWKPGAYRDIELVNAGTGEIKTVAKLADARALYGPMMEKLVGASDGHDLSLFFPVMSADGRRLMCKISRGAMTDNFRSKQASNRLGKFVFDLESGQWIGGYEFWGHPAWFPDGSAIIERGITVFQPGGKTSGKRYANGCIGDHQSVSPDSKFFTADSGIEKRENGKPGEWAVCVGEFETNEYVLLHRFMFNRGARSWRQSHPHPVFSADGNRVYFNVGDDGWTRLYVAEKR